MHHLSDQESSAFFAALSAEDPKAMAGVLNAAADRLSANWGDLALVNGKPLHEAAVDKRCIPCFDALIAALFSAPRSELGSSEREQRAEALLDALSYAYAAFEADGVMHAMLNAWLGRLFGNLFQSKNEAAEQALEAFKALRQR